MFPEVKNLPPMIYLSIDIEASGPFPGLFSLVSVGAVPVIRVKERWQLDEESTYYEELKPFPGAGELEEATNIHGLTTEYLAEKGTEPATAMENFAEYLRGLTKRYKKITPAAWPSSFDSPFVGWYFQHFLGENPLGWSAFDIPSFGMGLFRCSRPGLREQMRKAGIEAPKNPDPHNALQDAIEQGHFAAQLLNLAYDLRQQRPRR